jgi:hypothetical protein
MWENEQVVPMLDEDDSSDGPGDKQQQHQAGMEGGMGPGVPGVLPASRSRRSRWRLESRYAELLVGASEFPFCAWDATTYVHVIVHIPANRIDSDGLMYMTPHSDASIYTPLLLDPNAVYQPQLLSFAANADRVYRIEGRCVHIYDQVNQSRQHLDICFIDSFNGKT